MLCPSSYDGRRKNYIPSKKITLALAHEHCHQEVRALSLSLKSVHSSNTLSCQKDGKGYHFCSHGIISSWDYYYILAKRHIQRIAVAIAICMPSSGMRETHPQVGCDCKTKLPKVAKSLKRAILLPFQEFF